MAEKFYLLPRADSDPSGPHSLAEILTMLEDGAIGDEALCTVEGGDDWMPLCKILDNPSAEATPSGKGWYTIQSGRRAGEGPFRISQLKALWDRGELSARDVLGRGDGSRTKAGDLYLHWPIRPWLLVLFFLVGVPGLIAIIGLLFSAVRFPLS